MGSKARTLDNPQGSGIGDNVDYAVIQVRDYREEEDTLNKYFSKYILKYLPLASRQLLVTLINTV